MKKKALVCYLVVVLVLPLLSGCGGGTGGVGGVVASSSVSLSADKTQAIANDSDTVTLTASVKDGYGSPLVGQSISFNVSPGPSLYQPLSHTNADGTAVILIKYPPVGPDKSALLTVTATSGGVTSNEVVITFSNPPQKAAAVTLEADKTVLYANGTDKVLLTATVKDENDAPIAGQAVDFNVPSVQTLTWAISKNNFTNAAGQLAVPLELSPGRFSGTQTISVTASCGGTTSNAVSITLTQPPANAASVVLTADKTQALANQSDTVTLTATVLDSNGAPSPGQSIAFNIPQGAITGIPPGRTNINGQATIRVEYPPGGPGVNAVLAVTATSGSVTSNEVVITFSNPPQNAAAVVLTADKFVLLADGTDRVRLTATVTDGNGAPIAGQAVDFNIPVVPSLLRLIPLTNYTNANGQLSESIRLSSGFVGSQSLSITATSGGTTSNAVTITLTQPPL
jgi:adhesin/invasin